MGKLTQEQRDKAKIDLMGAYKHAVRYGLDNAEKIADRLLDEIAPHLQYAPALVDGDVVERMCSAYLLRLDDIQPMYREDRAKYDVKNRNPKLFEAMTAAYHVAREHCAGEMLGPVTNEEVASWSYEALQDYRPEVNRILAARRACLTAPKQPTKQERVVKILRDWRDYGMGKTPAPVTAAEIIQALEDSK